MSLLQKIKSDQLQARKDRETAKASLLTTLIGESAIIGKNDGNRETTDEEVIRVIKKFVKGLEELREHSNDPVKIVACEAEMNILEAYLPVMLNKQELTTVITAMIEGAGSGASMKTIMGGLKEGFAGLYDGKVASGIVKELLS